MMGPSLLELDERLFLFCLAAQTFCIAFFGLQLLFFFIESLLNDTLLAEIALDELPPTPPILDILIRAKIDYKNECT